MDKKRSKTGKAQANATSLQQREKRTRRQQWQCLHLDYPDPMSQLPEIVARFDPWRMRHSRDSDSPQDLRPFHLNMNDNHLHSMLGSNLPMRQMNGFGHTTCCSSLFQPPQSGTQVLSNRPTQCMTGSTSSAGSVTNDRQNWASGVVNKPMLNSPEQMTVNMNTHTQAGNVPPILQNQQFGPVAKNRFGIYQNVNSGSTLSSQIGAMRGSMITGNTAPGYQQAGAMVSNGNPQLPVYPTGIPQLSAYSKALGGMGFNVDPFQHMYAKNQVNWVAPASAPTLAPVSPPAPTLIPPPAPAPILPAAPVHGPLAGSSNENTYDNNLENAYLPELDDLESFDFSVPQDMMLNFSMAGIFK